VIGDRSSVIGGLARRCAPPRAARPRPRAAMRQALCDADRRILDVHIKYPGSTGDSLAHHCSTLGQLLADGQLPPIYHIIGDAAYINSEHMLTPVSGTVATMGVWADSYNFHHVSSAIPGVART